MDVVKARPPSVMDPTELSMGEVYAQALLDTLGDNEAAEEMAAELEGVLAALREVPGAQSLISGALLNHERRSKVLHHVFDGRVSEKMQAFLSVLDRHDRISALAAASQEFRRLLNKRQGRTEVTITTAIPLEESQRQAITDELCASLKSQALLTTKVDEELLGGAVLRIGDRVYDASIRAELHRIKESIAARRGQMRT